MTYDELVLWGEIVRQLAPEKLIGQSVTPEGWPDYLWLDNQLGITEYREYYNRVSKDDRPMSPELTSLLKCLAGPHGKTILRAYRISKGLEP